MFELSVDTICPGYDFKVSGVSYAGAPKNNTVMYTTKKVEHLLESLTSVSESLVFVETGSIIPEGITEKNAIFLTDNPQYEYARFVDKIAEQRKEEEKSIKYIFTDGGYYVSETAVIGENSYIEPGCIIGHGVKIGKNATILAGSVIKHAIIGDDFFCNEKAVIGSYSFTMADDNKGNKYRIPAMGKVIIGNNVEVGANNNIACGSTSDTIIDDYVKLDALIHIGHDVHLRKNVRITAGVTVAGFVDAGEKAYFGVGANIRNRINIGKNTVIGMGAVVTKGFDDDVTVVGNPAKVLRTNK